MTERQARLETRGFLLGEPPKPAALYRPVVVASGIAYVSGALPIDAGSLTCVGPVGNEVSVEGAQAAAALCAANVLRALALELGSLERILRVLRLGGYVYSAPGFSEQHLVINGASELLVHVLGEAGVHARSAIGVPGLPLGASVEVDAIVQIQ